MGEEFIFVKILLPQKPFLVKEAQSVQIPATEGPYLVLPNRAPSLKLLKNGVLEIKESNDSSETYLITSGVAKIRDDACTILTRHALNVAEINVSQIKEQLKQLEQKEIDVQQKHLSELMAEKIAFLKQVLKYCEKQVS